MRVSTMTVYRLIRDGELPAIRVGKHFRLRVTDVDRFLSARMVHLEDHTHDARDTHDTRDGRDARDGATDRPDPRDNEEHRWRAG